MRAFVAIDLPPCPGPVPEELRPEDHLTLHVFEELSVERLPLAMAAMAEAAEGCSPFELELRGVGAFPTSDRPRVLWAGVGEGATTLQALALRLRHALSSRGFPTERRPFVAHLTLGRVRSPREAAGARRFLTAPENATRVWSRTLASEILLKES